MSKRFTAPRLVVLAGLAASVGASICVAAVPTTSEGLLDRDSGPALDSMELGTVKPLRDTKPQTDVARPRGNPLWSIPLSTLTTTQERPIFSASRRPPPRAIVAPVARVSEPVPPKATVPQPSSMQLLGAVVGDRDAIAILLDQITREVVRLRVGEDRRGWILSSVQNREATIRKGEQTEVLALQRPDNTSALSGTAGSLPPPVPSSIDRSYAPFVPRSTPKNGEPDGL